MAPSALLEPLTSSRLFNACWGVSWLGRGPALQESAEEFKIYFLLGEPKSREGRKAFENARHLLEKIPGKKKLIPESEVEAFADDVAGEIAEHDGSRPGAA